MTIVVQPDGNTWKVDVVQEGSGDDLDRREMVKQIAARLKAEYDFEWLKSSISETLEAANRTLWGRQFQMISRASAPTCYNLGSREAYY